MMGSITASLSKAASDKKSRRVLKYLCECRETIDIKYLLKTEMIFNVQTPKASKDLLHTLPK